MAETMLLIYLDLTGYSKNNELIQLDFFKKFQQEIDSILYEELTNITSRAIAIPTGDGMIIGLTDSSDKHIKAVDFVFRIFKWCHENGYGMRCSVHAGPVHPVVDINRQNNIIGNSVNDAARMLAGTDDNTIVISKEFFRRFLQHDNQNFDDIIKIPGSEIRIEMLDEDTVLDKHSNIHNVVSVKITDGESTYGMDGKILTRHYTRLYAKDYPKAQSREKFIEQIENASHVVLYGIYHPNLIDILSSLKLKSRNSISFDVYFASSDLSKQLTNFFGQTDKIFDIEKRNETIIYIKSWAEKNLDFVTVNVYEYTDFPTFGLSAINFHQQDSGFIHASHYINSIKPEETPYIELAWKTKRPHPLYSFYSHIITNRIEKFRNVI
ncbi:nucleotidyl cyclase domain-containing protein [Spirochaeta dissipatitropha]